MHLAASCAPAAMKRRSVDLVHTVKIFPVAYKSEGEENVRKTTEVKA
jgi:hypothetical protein